MLAVDENRFVFSILSYSYSWILSLSSSSRLWQGTLADDLLSLWTFICSTGYRWYIIASKRENGIAARCCKGLINTSWSETHNQLFVDDGSDLESGAQLDNLHLTETWNQKQKRWHSNLKEMFAEYSAINQSAHHLRDSYILLQTDNKTLAANTQKRRSLTRYLS